MRRPTHCELISWQRFHALCRRLAHKIRESGYRPDIIVAIGRGGYMPARILSDLLGVSNLTSFKIEHYEGIRKTGKAFVRYPLNVDLSGLRVLLVDDVNDSGETLAAAIPHVLGQGTPQELRTAVLHHKAVSSHIPDYHAWRVVKWRWIIYPWALTEDLSALITAMRPAAREPTEIARRLAVEHRVRVPRRVLAELLPMIGLGDSPKPTHALAERAEHA